MLKVFIGDRVGRYVDFPVYYRPGESAVMSNPAVPEVMGVGQDDAILKNGLVG